MAGSSSRQTCEHLLSKLKQGQGALRKSIENIKVPREKAIATQKLLSRRKLESRCRDSLTIDLTKTSKLPKKRARLQQLSPDLEISPCKPNTKYPRTSHRSPSPAIPHGKQPHPPSPSSRGRHRPSSSPQRRHYPSSSPQRRHCPSSSPQRRHYPSSSPQRRHCPSSSPQRKHHTSPSPQRRHRFSSSPQRRHYPSSSPRGKHRPSLSPQRKHLPSPSSRGKHHTSLSPAEPRSKHPRRLSSTPIKNSGPALKKHSSPTPEVDLSLEDALLHGNKENVSHDDYSLPSPKLSKIVVNMSRSKAGPAQSSLRKTDGQEKRKKRGLTVSFVQNSETDNNTHKPGDSTARKLTRHPTQRNMGASLVDSLNTSRYGAMDRRYAQTHKEGKFPTGYPGEDPRLGYDWIAGLLDASESYLSERDDEYFDDMKEFRRVNFEDCHRPKEVRMSATEPPYNRQEGSDENSDDDYFFEDEKKTCVRSYVLNDRLFPMHMNSLEHLPGATCPACEDGPAKLSAANRYVRVSVPHSILQPTSQFKPHRRRSFDPVDSMGLAKHCLAGWETAKPCMIPPQPSVDLKSSLPKEDHHHHHNLSKRTGSLETELGRNLLDTSRTIEYSLRSRASNQ